MLGGHLTFLPHFPFVVTLALAREKQSSSSDTHSAEATDGKSLLQGEEVTSFFLYASESHLAQMLAVSNGGGFTLYSIKPLAAATAQDRELASSYSSEHNSKLCSTPVNRLITLSMKNEILERIHHQSTVKPVKLVPLAS